MPKKSTTIKNEKDNLYEEIAKHCDWLCIARYLKNEAKSALKYFHAHKLSNIKKNLKEFSDYLIFLNNENCERIEWFTEWKEIKRDLNNSKMEISNGEADVCITFEKMYKIIKISFCIINGNKEDFINFKKIMKKLNLKEG